MSSFISKLFPLCVLNTLPLNNLSSTAEGLHILEVAEYSVSDPQETIAIAHYIRIKVLHQSYVRSKIGVNCHTAVEVKTKYPLYHRATLSACQAERRLTFDGVIHHPRVTEQSNPFTGGSRSLGPVEKTLLSYRHSK